MLFVIFTYLEIVVNVLSLYKTPNKDMFPNSETEHQKREIHAGLKGKSAKHQCYDLVSRGGGTPANFG